MKLPHGLSVQVVTFVLAFALRLRGLPVERLERGQIVLLPCGREELEPILAGWPEFEEDALSGLGPLLVPDRVIVHTRGVRR